MPATPIGAHGTIRVREHKWDADGNPVAWRAITYYRDTDGRSRRVSKVGPSKAAAQRGLRKLLTERDGPPGTGELTRESRLEDVARSWLESVARLVEAGKRSPGTLRLYRLTWTNHLSPLVGALRAREVTVGRCNTALVSITDTAGPATAKTARAALSGLAGHAIRLGAMNPPNPVRDCQVIDSGPKRAPRAMSADERARWIAALEADEVAARRDMPDLTRMMLATGCRIAEMLAVTFDDVDLAAGTVAIDWQITQVTGVGLVRRSTKTRYGERTLRLPGWAVSLVRRRKLRFGYGPLFPHHRGRADAEWDRSSAWRDPSNTSRDFREARAKAGFEWVTSHVFRRTVATVLDEAGVPRREVGDHLGHSKLTMTDAYLMRKAVGERAARALEDIDPDQAAGDQVGDP